LNLCILVDDAVGSPGSLGERWGKPKREVSFPVFWEGEVEKGDHGNVQVGNM